MIQMELFPDLACVEPTPAMRDGRAHLLVCQHDGTLVYLPSTHGLPNRPRTSRPDAGPCPTCGGRVWSTADVMPGEKLGPFARALT